MNKAIIGLGSNIEPQYNIQKARDILSRRYKVLNESQFIQTSPVGYTDQDDFINGAVLIETELTPDDLKAQLKSIEKEMGRVVSEIKSGPRSIDLDILVFNGQITDNDVYTRSFLQASINELLPDLKIDRKAAN